MRLWPFRYEIRQQLPADSGVNSYLNDLANYYGSASASGADVYRTAAVEFCAGILGRAFMAAETTPRLPALDPLTLSMMARQTVLLGNAVWRIGVRASDIQLLPVVSYERLGRSGAGDVDLPHQAAAPQRREPPGRRPTAGHSGAIRGHGARPVHAGAPIALAWSIAACVRRGDGRDTGAHREEPPRRRQAADWRHYGPTRRG